MIIVVHPRLSVPQKGIRLRYHDFARAPREVFYEEAEFLSMRGYNVYIDAHDDFPKYLGKSTEKVVYAVPVDAADIADPKYLDDVGIKTRVVL